jgi:hypothetical protein
VAVRLSNLGVYGHTMTKFVGVFVRFVRRFIIYHFTVFDTTTD